jgi:hypothetical protein
MSPEAASTFRPPSMPFDLNGAALWLERRLNTGEFQRMAPEQRIFIALCLERNDLLAQEGLSSMTALAALPTKWATEVLAFWSVDATGHGRGH